MPSFTKVHPVLDVFICPIFCQTKCLWTFVYGLFNVTLILVWRMSPSDLNDFHRMRWKAACTHRSLDRGLGSGRRTIRALPVRVAGGDLGKLVSREPDFLCRGSSPMAPAMSLSMGQEPARPCDAMGQEPERAWWWWWW